MKDEKHGHIHHSKSTRDILDANRVLEVAGIKKGDVFLDAGCGDGFISLTASSIVGDEGKIYAMDVYPESMARVKEEVIKKNISNIEAIEADLTDKIPLNDNSIDLCVMANVIHGFIINNELEVVMEEIGRVIKQGGVFAVVEFIKVEAERGPPFSVRVAPQDVEDILTRYGFEVTETTEVGEHHYLTRSVKK